MKISIALCTYNGASFLVEQLESFLRQTRLPDELIVCDDRSSDETAEILENFAADARFHVDIHINEKNLGSTKNFEKAISLCTGDIIFLSDQDDVWLPEKIKMFEAEFLKDENVGLVFCDGELVDENLIPLNYKSWKAAGFTKKRQKQFLAGNTISLWTVGNVITGCMLAFRARYKNFVLPIPNNFQDLIHDHWIALLLAAVSKIVPLSLPLVKYRQHGSQQLGLMTAFDKTGSNLSTANKIEQKNSFANPLSEAVEIQKRLQAGIGEFSTSQHLAEFNCYVAHVQARAALQNKKAAKISTVLRELASLRYHQYSNGILSAVKDLLN